jgi:gluconolactonase
MRAFIPILFCIAAAAVAVPIRAQEVPDGAPLASIDLMTAAGTRQVGGVWRYSDTRIVEVEFRAPDASGQPGGQPVRTWDIEPHAGAAGYDDSSWEIIAPESLTRRRAGGRLCFNWYRIRLIIPERIGGIAADGLAVVFETSVDDYAEVWVDGELPRAQAQSGGSVIRGWNAANRVVVAHSVRAHQIIQIAVFGANGPLSSPPTNYIWMRTARLDFHAGNRVPFAVDPQEVNVDVQRLLPEIDAVVPANPKIFKLADGFTQISDAVWMYDGYLQFRDGDRHYRYVPGAGLQELDAGPVTGAAAVRADELGNSYEPARDGIRVVASGGRLLGIIHPPRHPVQVAWSAGPTLYLASPTTLYRMDLKVRGRI